MRAPGGCCTSAAPGLPEYLCLPTAGVAFTRLDCPMLHVYHGKTCTMANENWTEKRQQKSSKRGSSKRDKTSEAKRGSVR